MTELRDPRLEALFNQASNELDGAEFTLRVVGRARTRRFLMAGSAAAAAVILLISAWQLLAMPLLEFAILLTQLLTATLFDVGDGWLGLLMLPLNNIASLTVLGAKLLHSVRRRVNGPGLAR